MSTASNHAATTVPGSIRPPLSLDELRHRCMNNAAVATLILDKFEQQMRSDFQALQESVDRQDLIEVARITHALKGAAGAVAATSLRDRAKEFEDHARQGRLECLAGDLAMLRDECDRCLKALPAARSAFIVVSERNASERKVSQ